MQSSPTPYKFTERKFSQISDEKIPEREKSCAVELKRDYMRSTQVFQEVDKTQPATDTVGRPVPNMSGIPLATGEIKFCDDMPDVTSTYVIFQFLFV